MKKVLILEDSKERQKLFKENFIGADITMVETAPDAINALKAQKYDFMFFDHDLGGKVYVKTEEDNSGSGVARWLREHSEHMPANIFVHSLNEAGANNIISLVGGKRLPFVWTKQVNFEE